MRLPHRQSARRMRFPDCCFVTLKVDLSVRALYLEERELDRAVFSTKLVGVLPLVNGHVLNEIPKVAVLFGRQPVTGAPIVV
jgi:hypothetical protein